MLGIKPVSSAPAGLAPAGLAETVARLQILLCSPVTEVACLALQASTGFLGIGELRATPKNRSVDFLNFDNFGKIMVNCSSSYCSKQSSFIIDNVTTRIFFWCGEMVRTGITHVRHISDRGQRPDWSCTKHIAALYPWGLVKVLRWEEAIDLSFSWVPDIEWFWSIPIS